MEDKLDLSQFCSKRKNEYNIRFEIVDLHRKALDWTFAAQVATHSIFSPFW
jgi:hypothetical protein